MKPVLQLALDFVDLKRAVKSAQAGVAGGVDWLEVGTPLIKSEGLQAVTLPDGSLGVALEAAEAFYGDDDDEAEDGDEVGECEDDADVDEDGDW